MWYDMWKNSYHFAEEEKLGETIGEEWEHEEFDEELQEESILTVYDTDDFVSGAINSGPYSTIPVDLLEFEYPLLVNMRWISSLESKLRMN